MPASIAEQQNERPNAILQAHVPERANATATDTVTSNARKDTKRKQKEEKNTPLRYQKRSLLLLAVYLPFLIVPWSLTCVLAVRPLGHSSYYNQAGKYNSAVYHNMRFWTQFVDVMSSIASLLTVPITSALLAHGAVVYCQRTNLKHTLNLRKTFVLADRGWADLSILWRALEPKTDEDPFSTIASGYLWLAAILLLISAIQGPLSQALVTTETIYVITCDDVPLMQYTQCSQYGVGYSAIATDPEPAALENVPQGDVIPIVIKNLATVSMNDVQFYLWRDQSHGSSEPSESTSSPYYNPSLAISSAQNYFVSAVPNGTETGVLREHAMRLNSTVGCQEISRNAYPSFCDGSLPFTALFAQPDQFEMEVCVPGDQATSPWNLTRDKQDITEDMYIRTTVPAKSKLNEQGLVGFWAPNATLHCTANTTRGYFELGNDRNDHKNGPLLEKWPDEEDLRENFNDYLNNDGGSAEGIPSAINSHAGVGLVGPIGPLDITFESMERPTPGPLMTSALALFGKESMFYVAANSSNQTYPPITSQICQAGNIPFQRLITGNEGYFQQMLAPCQNINSGYTESKSASDTGIEMTLYLIASLFNPSNQLGNYVADALPVAVYLSTEAWLAQAAANAAKIPQYARTIYSSRGSPINRPVKTPAATIGISVLLVLQLAGLLVLVYYIYSTPTWTTALDSLAVAQLTKGADQGAIPPIGERDYDNRLAKTDGLVGVVSNKISVEEGVGDLFVTTHQLKLARGGQGVISKRLLGRRRSVQETLLEK